jgi:uncharacterized protein
MSTPPVTAPHNDAAEIERLKSSMMKLGFFVMTRRLVDASRLDDVMLNHYRWIIAQEKAGRVFASGPLFNADGSKGPGMSVLRAADFAEADRLAASDPFVSSGVMAYELARWQVNEGRITVSVDLSDGSCRVN